MSENTSSSGCLPSIIEVLFVLLLCVVLFRACDGQADTIYEAAGIEAQRARAEFMEGWSR